MKAVRALFAVLALSTATAAMAAPISFGSMFRDEGSDVIVDSLNNREWLGWDVVKGLTYAETVAATGAGGQFEGFSFAGINDAQMFVDSLLGMNACTTAFTFDTQICSTFENNNVQLLTGESSIAPQIFSSVVPQTIDIETVWFVSDNQFALEVGSILLRTLSIDEDWVSKNNDALRITEANSFSYSGTNGVRPVGWLLYRDIAENSNSVPEPASLALVGVALLGAAAVRRRKAV